MKTSHFAKAIAGLTAIAMASAAHAQTAPELSFWIRASDAGFVEPLVKT